MRDLKPKGFSQEELSQLETGVPLKRACAFVAPEIWELYRNNSVSVWFIGDPQSEERFFAGARACQELRNALLLLARAGDLEFRVLEPPGSPNARWTALSDDVVRALESDDLDIDESKIQLPDGPRLEARIFDSPAPDWRTSTSFGVDTQALSAQPPKVPAKVAVTEAWNSLSNETKDLIKSRGGKKKVALILKSKLPGWALETIERELRRHWSESPL